MQKSTLTRARETRGARRCGLLAALVHDRAAVSGRAAYKDEVEWLWALWSAHNTYAYVRLWYAFLARIDSLQSHLYSVAILLAGATAGGQAVGFVFVPLLVAACYAYQAWLHRSAKGLLDRLEAIEDLEAALAADVRGPALAKAKADLVRLRKMEKRTAE